MNAARSGGASHGRDGEEFDPLRYLALLAQARCVPLAHPVQRWREEWPPIYHRYLAALQQRALPIATREFVCILQLHTRYEPVAIAAALEQAYAFACWSADGVEYSALVSILPNRSNVPDD